MSQYEHNPYHAPTADLEEYEEEYEYDTTPFYKSSGRIGRIRYSAYYMLMSLVLMLLMIPVGMIFAVLMPISESLAWIIGGFAYVLVTIGAMYAIFATSIRRLNDLNKTGWISLLFFVPLAGLLLWLYLMIARGDEGVNDYGAPSEPPTMIMYILGLIAPIFMLVAILGVIMAIALPAYQDYVMRASMGM